MLLLRHKGAVLKRPPGLHLLGYLTMTDWDIQSSNPVYPSLCHFPLFSPVVQVRKDKTMWKMEGSVRGARVEGDFALKHLIDNDLKSEFVSVESDIYHWVQVDFSQSLRVRSNLLLKCWGWFG